MIKIVDSIPWNDEYPVLAKKEYLSIQPGVIRTGYFTDESFILPFIVKGKSVFRWMQLPIDVIGRGSKEERLLFLDGCMKKVEEEFNVSHVMSVNTALFKECPNNSHFCKWGSYKVDLTQNEELLFSQLHSKHRNVIRKAETIGTTVDFGERYAITAVKLIQDTYKRQNGKHGLDYDYVTRMMELGDHVDWWIVRDSEGNNQGSAVFLWSEGASCYYMHGGSSAHTTQGAMNYLIWKAMLEMKSRGVKCFDFVGARLTTEEGSKLEGIQRFKSRFGSTLYEGYMFRYVCKPLIYSIYTLLMKLYYAIHKERYTDIIAEERSKGNI